MPTTIQLPPGISGRAPRPRWRRAALYTAGATGVLVALLGTLTLAANAMADHDDNSFSVGGIRELIVDLDAGDVTLVAGATDGEVSVDTTREWAWGQPNAEHTVENGVLTLTGDCPSISLGKCTVDHRITVPADIEVHVSISSGNIAGLGLDLTELDVNTDSGDIRATDVEAPSFRGDTSSGDVEVSFTTPPDEVNVESSSGSVTVTVPDTAYSVDAGTSSGQVRIDVNDDPDATRHISAHTSSGDVTVGRR